MVGWSVVAAMPLKDCFFNPDCRSTLFSLPGDGGVRDRWYILFLTSLIIITQISHVFSGLHILQWKASTLIHNLCEFNAGFAQRFVLKDGAVPTLRTEVFVYGPFFVNVFSCNSLYC